MGAGFWGSRRAFKLFCKRGLCDRRDGLIEHEAGIAEIVIPIFSIMLHLPFHLNDLASVSTSQPRCIMETKGMP
jgi:hypothetical protein